MGPDSCAPWKELVKEGKTTVIAKAAVMEQNDEGQLLILATVPC